MNSELPLLAWNVPLFVVLPLGAIDRAVLWLARIVPLLISVNPKPPLLMPICPDPRWCG